MNCKYAKENYCLVAVRIAGVSIAIRTDKACKCCLQTSTPKAENVVTVSLAISTLYRNGDRERATRLTRKFGPLLREPRPWSQATHAKPSLFKQIGGWRESVRRWKAAGSPVRSDEEVAWILHEHCEPCKYYNDRRKQCRVCGCFCRATGRAEFNKPKMLTERCPLTPPKWGDDTQENIPGGEHNGH